MDTNLKIIELVQRRPVLYKRCNSFAGRALMWREIADILKTDVTLVKSRWHLLRAKFMEEYSSVLKGNRTSFKYLTDMSFLTNHINLEAFDMYSKENDQYRTEPEFNITKKDLEDASDDDSTIEFIELELDDESHRELAQIPFGATEEVNQNEYVEPIYVDEYSNTSQSMEEEEIISNIQQKPQEVEMFVEVRASEKSVSEQKTPEVEMFVDVEASDKSVSEKIESEQLAPEDTIIKEDPRESIEEKTEVTTSAVDLENSCITKPPKPEEKLPLVSEKLIPSPKIENYRCEDTIFGELVTATLRQMQTDKKKAVKREIMNLLFT